MVRFWSKVEVGDGCWLWTGATWNGYGAFKVGEQAVLAHRFAYEQLVGPVPTSLHLDHRCHNGTGCIGGHECLHRRCVNPAHLEAVTRRENIRRGDGVCGLNARKTHCSRGHLLSGDNLYVYPDGGRKCRTCKRSYQSRHDAARRRRSAA